MLIKPSERIIEAHSGLILPDVNDFDFSNNLDLNSPSEIPPSAVNLEVMWRRGRFAGSLNAENAERSLQWRKEYVGQNIPDGPKSDFLFRSEGGFWPWLAQRNGIDERKTIKASGLSKSAFESLRNIAFQKDILFQLEYWSPPGTNSEAQTLLYWTDPGTLNYFLGLNENILSNWGSALTDRQRERLKFLRAKSWETFVISSILRAAGSRAKGQVWLAADGEIDLILHWFAQRSTWAIEVTVGRKKKLSPAFLRGCDETQSERTILVYNEMVGKPRTIAPNEARSSLEWMTLTEVLRAVLEGP